MSRYLYKSLIPVGLVVLLGIRSSAQPAIIQVVNQATVSKVWDGGQHNAFTDLVWHNGRFFLTFREAGRHVPQNHSEDGKIRVLVSEDGKKWDPFFLLSLPGLDLRDPKFSVTPGGKLMLNMGGSYYENGKLLKRVSHVSFLQGETFTTPIPLKYSRNMQSDHNWLWTVTWNKRDAYGVVYRKGETFLVKSRNGLKYKMATQFDLDHFPNEAKPVFLRDGKMMIVIRRDGNDLKPSERTGLIGISEPPYQDWKWKDLGIRLGGPHLIPFYDDQWLLGTRRFDGNQKFTAVYLLMPDGTTKKLIDLPSGGDTSYPGMVIRDGMLWVSYYSSHEGKSNIYLAQLDLDDILKLADKP